MSVVVYGSDLQALTDLPDPEIICSEITAAAYSCARRWATTSGALQEIGEVQQYDSIDLRDWLGSRNLTDPAVIADLQSQATQVLYDDPFVQSAQVAAAFAQGTLTLTAQVQGSTGPFSLVVAAGPSGITTQILLPGQV